MPSTADHAAAQRSHPVGAPASTGIGGCCNVPPPQQQQWNNKQDDFQGQQHKDYTEAATTTSFQQQQQHAEQQQLESVEPYCQEKVQNQAICRCDRGDGAGLCEENNVGEEAQQRQEEQERHALLLQQQQQHSTKELDVSIHLCCWLACVPLSFGALPYKTTLRLDPYEVTKTDIDLCGSHVSTRPYTELGSIDRGSCFCCVSVQSAFGTLSPGCGCNAEKTDEIIRELQSYRRRDQQYQRQQQQYHHQHPSRACCKSSVALHDQHNKHDDNNETSRWVSGKLFNEDDASNQHAAQQQYQKVEETLQRLEEVEAKLNAILHHFQIPTPFHMTDRLETASLTTTNVSDETPK